jgi:GNAT superfamily N-acetyltransferase
MLDYRIRSATHDDADVLVHHRVAMFKDMGVVFDADTLGNAFRRWLGSVMAEGTYRAWLVEHHPTSNQEPLPRDGIVAGGGITVIPWPPGPRYAGDRLAFVYNVYTEPAHRRRGLSRLVMETIHEWCRAEGITSLALNTSQAGQPLYESMGYVVTPSPMMFFALQ